MLDLAIVGGGPGGLMSAWYLKRKLGDLCRVTIYEASDRLGGKIVTRKFDTANFCFCHLHHVRAEVGSGDFHIGWQCFPKVARYTTSSARQFQQGVCSI